MGERTDPIYWLHTLVDWVVVLIYFYVLSSYFMIPMQGTVNLLIYFAGGYFVFAFTDVFQHDVLGVK